MNRLRNLKCRFVAVAGVVFSLACGCQRPSPPPATAPAPPEVFFAKPTSKIVSDFEDFTGRLEAVHSVEVRARVTGYLDRVCFKEGAEVKAGDVLFEIDPRTYKAEAARAEATLRQALATKQKIQRDYDRAQSLIVTRSIGREEFDRLAGELGEAEAAAAVAQGTLDIAKLQLSFCQVRAPIAGRLSRQFIDPGNLVKADDTRLTTIVSLDPMHVYFDVDERTVLKIRRLIHEGKIKSARENATEVQVGLADEDGFSLTGTIDFIDNRIESGTGTLRVRAVVANPKQLLSAGLFVRIRLPVGTPYRALIVPEQALASDQGQRYLYVIEPNDSVTYRRVTTGGLIGADRIVRDGLALEERVVVSGLQRLRPGMKVTPRSIELLESKSNDPGPASSNGVADHPAAAERPNGQATTKSSVATVPGG